MKRMKMLLNGRHIVEIGEDFSSKMQPVNAPGIFFITAIRMFNILRKNEKFIRTYSVSCLTDLVPSVSVNTVKNEVFGKSLFAISVMARGVRIITKACNI